jgi:hemoglobin
MVRDTRTDIVTRTHVEELVNSFYDKVKRDDLLAPVFAQVNWPQHLPVMYNFWSSVLLGGQSYQGNPFARHVHLQINRQHFNRWLALFNETVDERFTGFNANEAKNRAHTIAQLFQYKMGL